MVEPTGECWCGCGGRPEGKGSYFVQGHDKYAQSAVVKVEYGSIVELLVDHGYGPGGKNPRQEREWLEGQT